MLSPATQLSPSHPATQTTPMSRRFFNQPKAAGLLFVLALIFSAIIPGQVAAAEYTIQIGAFSNPNSTFVEPARTVGQVNSTTTSEGITLFTVGRYNSMADARGALDQLASNYPDAFVRNMPSNAMPTSASPSPQPVATQSTGLIDRPATTRRLEATTASRSDSDLWNSLSDEERKRVVYLDGVLHVKQGEKFVPLAEHRRGQN